MPPPTFDEPRRLYAVEWRTVFPALHILRAFRIALYPGKMLLGLVYIAVVYGAGRALDALWQLKPAYMHQYIESNDAFLPDRMGVAAQARASGPFDVMLKWELSQLHELTAAVMNFSFGGVARALYGFVIAGPVWAFTKHPVFAVVMALIMLVCWAIFGGAIARIAAVHVTRDETISVRNALRFSVGKLLSFTFAPLILAVFVVLVGVAIATATWLLMLVPAVGPLMVGLLFIIVLLAGFVLTVTLFGSVGGFSLMYPTVAVEGSDAFDAISTSFSYLFAKPLRLFLYSLFALVYGALTYMLAKWFVFVMFTLIHSFQIWFLSDAGTVSAASKFNEFFPPPAIDSLSYDLDYQAIGEHLGAGAKVGASIVSFWFYLVVALLGAYVLSYYFSASTIIYTLLRYDVERTELDDVYVEHEDEEELAESAVPDAPVSTTTGVPLTPGPTGAPPPTA